MDHVVSHRREDREWYEDFFTGIAMDLWDEATPEEATQADCEFIERTLGVAAGAAVLDIPCGRGRHSITLAKHGMKMTAVDISAENIDKAKALDRAGSIEWVCLDMRRFERPATFEGAFCWGNSFAYTTHADTRAFLGYVSTALKRGAKFILHTGIAAESLLPHLKERDEYRFGEIVFGIENAYNVKESCLQTVYSFTKAGRTERKSGRQFVYTVAEISRLLSEAGLRPQLLIGSLDGQPFKLMDQQLIVVAEKQR